MKYEIITRFDKNKINQIIMLKDEIGIDMDQIIYERSINLLDDGVKKALIQLGWTPPKEDK